MLDAIARKYDELACTKDVKARAIIQQSINDLSVRAAEYVIPNEFDITSQFGYRRRFGRMHYGIDLSVNRGDTIRAAFDGKVRVLQQIIFGTKV